MAFVVKKNIFRLFLEPYSLKLGERNFRSICINVNAPQALCAMDSESVTTTTPCRNMRTLLPTTNRIRIAHDVETWLRFFSNTY